MDVREVSGNPPPEAEKQALSGGTPGKFRSKKTMSVVKVKTGLGEEGVYHSLEELPPELRAALEKAQKKLEK